MRNRNFRPCVARLDDRISPSAGIVINYGPLIPPTVAYTTTQDSTANDPNLVVSVDQSIQFSSGHETGYDPDCPPILP